MTADLTSHPLPAWITDLLATPPTAGSGVHWWLYRCACALAPWRAAEEIHRLLTQAGGRCARTITAHELNDAVNRRQCNWTPDGLSSGLRIMTTQFRSNAGTAAPWPKADWQAITRVADKRTGMADLWETSPIRLEGDISAREFVEAMFPGDPLLCFAKEAPADSLTLPWRDWRGMEDAPGGYGLMVPSPMTRVVGKRQDGRNSTRCLDNTGPRRFLIAEFDFKRTAEGEPRSEVDDLLDSLATEREPRAAPDLCAGILLHLLSHGAPLLLAVFSGGKSVHGWFPTYGAADETLRPFFTEARRLGADSATWSPCQLVRIPEGTRSNGRRQPVIYFNPALLPAA